MPLKLSTQKRKQLRAADEKFFDLSWTTSPAANRDIRDPLFELGQGHTNSSVKARDHDDSGEFLQRPSGCVSTDLGLSAKPTPQFFVA